MDKIICNECGETLPVVDTIEMLDGTITSVGKCNGCYDKTYQEAFDTALEQAEM